jgi:hypothetical protein
MINNEINLLKLKGNKILGKQRVLGIFVAVKRKLKIYNFNQSLITSLLITAKILSEDNI